MNLNQNNKTVLITGANGLIGKETIPYFKSLDYKIFAISTQKNGYVDGVNWLQTNILDEKAIDNIMQKVKPTHLLHLAWKTTGLFNDNVNFDFLVASINLLKYFTKNGGKKVVIAGTYIEYAENDEKLDEYSSKIQPQHIYGNCKNILKETAELYCKKNNVDFAWCRIFSAYGVETDLRRLTGYVINNLMNNEQVVIKSGSLIRDYIYSKDVANAFVKVLNSDKIGVFNISTGIETTIKEFVFMIGQIMEKEDLIIFKEEKNNQYKKVVGNNTRLTSEIGWKPEYSLKSGLQEVVNIWRKNNV